LGHKEVDSKDGKDAFLTIRFEEAGGISRSDRVLPGVVAEFA
jgi:hypothetical protein